MAIIKWDPFQNVATLQDRINRLFEDSFPRSREEEEDLAPCAWRPSVDIYETPENIIIEADLPGISKNQVSVEVKDNILTLRGERALEATDHNYLKKERCCGTFQRAFTMQYTVTPEKIKAKFKDGVLEISIPKPEEEKPKRISVNID